MGGRWVGIGAAFGGLAVVLGAFLAHGLTPKPDEMEKMTSPDRQSLAHRLEVFETGARYEMYHALALVGVGLTATLRGRSGAWMPPGGCSPSGSSSSREPSTRLASAARDGWG